MESFKENIIRLLRKSERYTKTNMVYLVKNGGWLGMGQVISSAVAFLLSIAFANLFPKEAYGEYRYLFSIVGVAGAFSLTGMDVALSQAVARGFDGTLSRSFAASLRWSLLASGILGIIAAYYFISHNAELGWSLIIAASATPLLKSFSLYGPFLVGKKDFGRRTRYGMLYDIVPAAAIACALVFTDVTLAIVATYFIAYASIASILYFSTRRIYPSNEPADDLTTGYSKHLSLMNFVGTISFQLDKILMFHYLGAAQLAVYSFALAMPQQIRQIQKHIGTLALPRFSEQPFEVIQKHIGYKAIRFFCVMFFIATLYIIAAPWIFRLFFPQYIESIVYSQIFALVLLVAPVMLYKQALTAHRKTRTLYFINTTLPFIKIVLMFPLISIYGVGGALASLLVTECLGGILTIGLFYRKAN